MTGSLNNRQHFSGRATTVPCQNQRVPTFWESRIARLANLFSDPRNTMLEGYRSGRRWILKWRLVADSDEYGLIMQSESWEEYLAAVRMCIAIRKKSAVRKSAQSERSSVLRRTGLAPQSNARAAAGGSVQ